MDKCKFCHKNEAEICPKCSLDFIHAGMEKDNDD